MAKWGVLGIIRSQTGIDWECMRLTEVIQKTIKEKVPLAKLGPHCRRWWMKELGVLRQEMLKSRRKAHTRGPQPDLRLHEKFRECRRKYSRELERTKRDHWRNWLEQATDPDIWTVHRYINMPASDGGKTRIPDLISTTDGQQRKVNTNESKGNLLISDVVRLSGTYRLGLDCRLDYIFLLYLLFRISLLSFFIRMSYCSFTIVLFRDIPFVPNGLLSCITIDGLDLASRTFCRVQ